MTRDDILTLAKAGFTAQQIAALASVGATPPAPAPAAAPAAAPSPAPAPAPAQAPAPAPAQGTVDEILTKLGVLTDTLQSSAILGAQQPGQETADDILAHIIAPPRPEGK